MELIGIISSNYDKGLLELFGGLVALCDAPTAAAVQTFALDEVLQAIIDNADDDTAKLSAVDLALRVNECVQRATLPERCSDRVPSQFSGDSFYFTQYVFTMKQFEEEKQRIDIPNATVIFPKGFDKQIARDYTLATGDPVIRFSCVTINMARTDTIISTGIPIDSAVIGMTAIVFVNETSFTLELGHYGEPIEGVILRIYRQAQRGKGRGTAEERIGEEERKEKVQRYDFTDDCDESISCSYYEGQGLLSPGGCVTVDVTEEWVDCSCTHYSNFGLLFSTCSSEVVSGCF
mmetsp:Transcript_16218/g.25210  ORF Transcript_16218/g.25210 Transcript_16218/m.25210 type:complete len:291 (-) Transcript_16218:177-1049(-)